MNHVQEHDTAEKIQYGHIEFTGKDIAVPGLKFDRIAVSGRGELLMVSLICELHNLKRVKSILVGGAKVTVMASGVQVKQPSQPEYFASGLGRLSVGSDGYQVWTHRIGYGFYHALFMTRTQGFMPIVTPNTLWQELKKVRFTTPILKEWMPYIAGSLIEENLLEEARVHNCKCGILSALSTNLDDIVSRGLKAHALLVPQASGHSHHEATDKLAVA